MKSIIKNVLRTNLFLVYFATGLAFLSQFVRDFSIFHYSGVIGSAQLFSYLYLSQSVLSVLTNIVLFKRFDKRSLITTQLVLILLFIMSKLYCSEHIFYTVVFIEYGVFSALLGNILLFDNKLFFSRSREFFLQLIVFFLVILISRNFLDAYCIIIWLLLLVNLFYFQVGKNINHTNALNVVASALFSIPSLLLQIIFYYLSLSEYYQQFPMQLRLGVYLNALVLAPIILLKSANMGNLKKIIKYMNFLTIVFVLGLVVLVSLSQYIIIPIALGLLFSCITYSLAAYQFSRNGFNK